MRGLTFVVYVKRAAPPRHRAVVNDRAFLACNTLANEPGKSGRLFTIKIGFQSMADGFMQEHAGPAGTKDNFHFTGRSLEGIQLKNRLSRGFFGEIFGSLVVRRRNPGPPDRLRPRCRERNFRLSWRCSPRSSELTAVNLQRRFRRTPQLECCVVHRRSWPELL